VDDALRNIADVSYEAGTKLYYGIVPVTGGSFEFRTWVDQPGRDRTDDPRLVFSMDRGNLRYVSSEWDYSREVNYVYAGGWGEEQERFITEVEDSARVNASAINRREGFVNAQSETDAGRTDEGEIELFRNQPIRRFRAEITDAPWTRYGQHWDLGDRVMVEHGGQAPCLVAGIHVTVDEDGRETIIGRCEWQ